MLFNSYAFIFSFLPICLAGYFLLGSIDRLWPIIWLGAMSFVFYAISGPQFVWLLAASIIINYFAGNCVLRFRNGRNALSAKMATGLAIAFNLAVLCYYKYAGFFLVNANEVFGFPSIAWNVVLPIGISFYTFTQIAFIVDCYVGRATRTGFPEYALFVSYFPHLIAGPILHHAEMIPQFRRPNVASISFGNISVGAAIFIVGLAKKIHLADNLAPYADIVFDSHKVLSFSDAWIGALAYTLQIYFDFSGYCDMAIGISRMLNIDIPVNFYSPYRATSVIEFWRRWHMTLSRFLRDYLYVALGGNRKGAIRRYANLMVTMLLGGLWHGAAWTFVVWGGLHGVYLLINHAFRRHAPSWLRVFPGHIFVWGLGGSDELVI
jgi:alginate O-acetyltransferase complex protein AlgI